VLLIEDAVGSVRESYSDFLDDSNSVVQMAPGKMWFKKPNSSSYSKRHKEIEKKLSDDKKKQEREIKIILLG
jgi:hypothetical protein